MIDVFCFVAACTIVIVSTLGCAGTIDVVGFKFVENISAKRSNARIVSSSSCNVGEDRVGFFNSVD